jgi:hypothetical protein
LLNSCAEKWRLAPVPQPSACPDEIRLWLNHLPLHHTVAVKLPMKGIEKAVLE